MWTLKLVQTVVSVPPVAAINEGLGASEIARQMNIERTSVYRLLKKVEMK